MGAAAEPDLEPGRVYRTRDFARWGANAPRLARRYVSEGKLIQLAHGLFAVPKPSRFGAVLPDDEEVMRAFLDGGPFIFTGPERWNALGLGSTAAFALPMVYNTKRTGTFDLGGRRYVLSRVAFPENPPPEWFVIDLIENAAKAGVSRASLADGLVRSVACQFLDRDTLQAMALRYGTKRTQKLVQMAIDAGTP